MLVAVSWTTMPTLATATDLQRLADRDGTGNITELSPGGVHFTGRYYDSHITVTTVVIAEAEPAAGSQPTSTLLRAAATTALGLPRP